MATSKTNKTETAKSFDLAELKPNQLKELKGWEKTQKQVVKENPFVEIKDRETYEIAKKHRTSLVSARTDLQKQEKTIASVLKKFRDGVKVETQKLIDITLPFEEKQQSEVKRYEAELDAIKEKERIEEEQRVQSIKDIILHAEEQLNLQIDLLTFENLKESEEVFDDIIISEGSENDFAEFGILFDEMVERQKERFQSKKEHVQLQEQKRIEQLQLERKNIINECRADALTAIEGAKIHSSENLISELETIFLITKDLGSDQPVFDRIKKEMFQKAEQKISDLKERQIEIQKQLDAEKALEEKNRVANIREMMFDLIEQMTTKNRESTNLKIQQTIDQDVSLIPKAVSEFKKMKQSVEKELNRKNEQLAELEKQENEKLIERTKIRSEKLREIGFKSKANQFVNEQFNVHESNVSDWDEIDFNNFVEMVEKHFETIKNDEKRQKELNPDKEILTGWLTSVWDNIQKTVPKESKLKTADAKTFLKESFKQLDEQIEQLDEHLKNL